MAHKFGNANGFHHGQSAVVVKQGSHFGQRAGRHHLVKPGIGAGIKFIARHINQVAFDV